MINTLKKYLSTSMVNPLLFQGLWAAAVIGGAHQLLWPACVMFLLLAIWTLHPSRKHPSDLLLIVIAVSIGFALDTIWIQLNLMDYTSSWPNPHFAPLWIVLLWMSVGLIINHSLAFVKKHPAYAFLFGLLAAPFTYYAGSKLGAITYVADPIYTSLILSVSWACFFSLLAFTAKHAIFKDTQLKATS